MAELPPAAVSEEEVVFLANSLCLLVDWVAAQSPGKEDILAYQVVMVTVLVPS